MTDKAHTARCESVCADLRGQGGLRQRPGKKHGRCPSYFMWAVGLRVDCSQKERELQVGRGVKAGPTGMWFYPLPVAYKVSDSHPPFFKLPTKWRKERFSVNKVPMASQTVSAKS